MAITAKENLRFQQVIDTIDGDGWRLPIDCTRWDVRDVVVHVVAARRCRWS